MSRPRKVSDDQLFAATQAVMARVGPRDLTLAAIADEAGVTAAVLVQRFGSKRQLLLALWERYAGESGGMFDALAARHRSPLAALRAYAACMAGIAASPAAVARNLAYLQMDLTDPDIRPHLMKQAKATRAGLTRLITAAFEAGELVVDRRDAGSTRRTAAKLARTVEAVIGGSLLTWAFFQNGSAAAWIRADLDAVLEPYLARPRARRRR